MQDASQQLKSPVYPRPEGIRLFMNLLPLVGLLWVFLYLRLDRIADFPLFIDEVHHIHRGRIVWSFRDLQVSTAPSKFLLYYFLGLFDAPYFDPAWIGRVPVALFSLIGAASTFALSQFFFSRQTGMLSVAVLSVFPFMLFHERMALTDSFAASITILMVWWSIITIQNPSRHRAIALGMLISLMMMAKLVTLPLAIMPVMAVFLFSQVHFQPDKPLRPQLARMWEAYGPVLKRVFLIVLAVWGVIMVFYVGRGLISPDSTNPIVDDYIYEAGDRGSVLSANFNHVREIFLYLWSPVLALLNLMAFIILAAARPRVAIFLLIGIVPVWLMLTILAARPNSRYLTVVGHLWIVGLVGGVYVASQWLQRHHHTLQWIPVTLVILWIAVWGLPFASTLATDATAVELPQAEVRGYYQNLSGYAFGDVFDRLEAATPISNGWNKPFAISVTLLCGYVHYYHSADRDFEIQCLPGGSDERVDNLNKRLTEYGAYYLIWENVYSLDGVFDPATIQGNVVLIDSYQRPHQGTVVDLYRLEAH